MVLTSSIFLKKLIIAFVILLILLYLYKSILKITVAGNPKALDERFQEVRDLSRKCITPAGCRSVPKTPCIEAKPEVLFIQPSFLFLINNKPVNDVLLRDQIENVFVDQKISNIYFDKNLIDQNYTVINASFPYTTKNVIPSITRILRENYTKIYSNTTENEIDLTYIGNFQLSHFNNKKLITEEIILHE